MSVLLDCFLALSLYNHIHLSAENKFTILFLPKDFLKFSINNKYKQNKKLFILVAYSM